MQAHGTDIELIKTWWNKQLGSSWCLGCTAVKTFYSNQRTLDPQSYYWNTKEQIIEDEYTNLWKKGAEADDYAGPEADDYNMCYPYTTNKEKTYIDAFTIWHAYIQEVLIKTKFYHNDPDNKQVCLIRTNSQRALKASNITQFSKGNIIPNAAYDSFSLINIFFKGIPDKVITESLVPHHRIIHLYPFLTTSLCNSPCNTQELTKWLINNAYDQNGKLLIDRNSPSAVEKFIESYIYHQYTSSKNQDLLTPFVNANTYLKYYYYWEGSFLFNFFETHISDTLPFLPKQLPSENAAEILEDNVIQSLSKNIKNHLHFQETEVIVLSGPDLPFDYFYNTDEDLSALEQNLYNGNGACKGYKLTETAQ